MFDCRIGNNESMGFAHLNGDVEHYLIGYFNKLFRFTSIEPEG